MTPHRIFPGVDLAAWVYGTVEKHRAGASWRPAWVDTYREIDGKVKASGEKGCPMMATRTLYGLSRLAPGACTNRAMVTADAVGRGPAVEHTDNCRGSGIKVVGLFNAVYSKVV